MHFNLASELVRMGSTATTSQWPNLRVKTNLEKPTFILDLSKQTHRKQLDDKTLKQSKTGMLIGYNHSTDASQALTYHFG